MEIFLGIREDIGKYEIVDKKTGALNAGDYHNYLLFYATDDMKVTKNTTSFVGYESAEYKKVKSTNFEKVFGQAYSEDILTKRVLSPCNIIFNGNGDVRKVEFLDVKKQ